MSLSFTAKRRYPAGAEYLPENGGLHFRVWAPGHEKLQVVFAIDPSSGKHNPELPSPLTMEPEENGYFSAQIEAIPPGILYGFRLDNSDEILPDPASRYQPHGIQGLSAPINASRFVWSDKNWPGVLKEGNVLYEMHIGTFTKDGTWEAASRELEELSRIGITVLEILPVAEFEGKFNWGYDGIFQFAPSRMYGHPDHFRRFVDTAHRLGIGVILDVVYNHFGPGRELFRKFSPFYFSSRHKAEWGEASNLDGQNCGPVREYFLSNARYWIEEFHLDGLRIDATQQIFDDSSVNLIKETVDIVRSSSGGKRTLVIGESEPQDSTLMSRYGLDSLWNDDFHRTAMVALTGHAEAYFSDYMGTPQEFISSAKYGYLYQGQYYTWQKKTRGTPSLDLPAECFINYLQNHDQIANTCRGIRVHRLSGPGRYRALTALLLLCPQTPLLFQGQEFASSSFFYYFADHDEGQKKRSAQGRKIFLSQFKSIASVGGPIGPEPSDPDAFTKSKLNFSEREIIKQYYRLHRDLLEIRKNDPVFRTSGRKGVDGAVLGREMFLLRYFGLIPSQDRLLIINLGRETQLFPNPEPLSAAPQGLSWKLLWYSEAPEYGGDGAALPNGNEIWNIAGHTAFFMGTA
ncbi:MAG TPA: alpha-amylase family glycosyl hydrolase [Chitinispirillaceae bacterium]|jgi:maltooligosyltrehalose trehalohydrolase|nr:alpha-amylase family glycosyl hydrolase [Chitinispirillaceae bacterium]